MESELAHLKRVLRDILEDIRTAEQDIQSNLASVETMRWEQAASGYHRPELDFEISRKHYEAFKTARFHLWLIRDKIEGEKL